MFPWRGGLDRGAAIDRDWVPAIFRSSRAKVVFHRKLFGYADSERFRNVFADRFMLLGGPPTMALFGKPQYGSDDDWLLLTDFDFAFFESISPGGWTAATDIKDGGWELLLGHPDVRELLNAMV